MTVLPVVPSLGSGVTNFLLAEVLFYFAWQFREERRWVWAFITMGLFQILLGFIQ